MALLEAAERVVHIAKETDRSMPAQQAVPLSIVFVDTKEIFLRHKVLNRFVQREGNFTYINRRGRIVVVAAYGPTATVPTDPSSSLVGQ